MQGYKDGNFTADNQKNSLACTRQHYDEATKDDMSWQREMPDKSASLYIIGYEHFNKSMTLDIENRLMHYMLSAPGVRRVHNLCGNPQNKYYPVEELDIIFSRIWKELRSDNREFFPTESVIRDSAIFKALPLHKLTNAQIGARDMIIDRVKNALQSDQTGQIIFIEGEAGTGKTVLNSSTFYEIFCQAQEHNNRDIRCRRIRESEKKLSNREKRQSETEPYLTEQRENTEKYCCSMR